MDDVLKYRPQSFKMLRAFEGLTFIKIDDEENRALREYISLSNEFAYDDINNNTFSFSKEEHESISSNPDLHLYYMDISKALTNEKNKDYVFSEMLIESTLLQALSNDTTDVIGHWDYLTHQVIASPFKPLKYIDKIDIFGYKFSKNYPFSPRLITKFLLVEMKKDTIDRAALEQTMQYVDWICHEYASGDYSKIEAYVVGERARKNIQELVSEICQRSFIAETHPAKPMRWNGLKLIKYTLGSSIVFENLINETP